ncbi:MAG TPA: hypothetical protein VHU44_16865 [Acidobacteriaceae bacterium]|jgi:hypothetical protein|nr:hypothetical protein [Acidobacteriaceae bacterium]
MFIRRLTRFTAIGAAAIALAGLGYSQIGAAAAQSSAPTSGQGGPANRPSNARSGPAAGGAAGTVESLSTSGFAISTSTGQKLTVETASSTAYRNGTSPASASAIAKGEGVVVLGTVDGTVITATQVIVQPAAAGGAATSSAAAVIPFERGAPSAARQAGQIPANYQQGSGTIVSGTQANNATEAALAAYPGGIVNRVVQLSDGEYEVHNIGVRWPHHIFVSRDFKVTGAE